MRKIPIYCISQILLSSGLWGGSATWNVNASGDWNVATNWTPVTFPNGVGEIATFGNVITANRTISLSSVGAQNITVGHINFNDDNRYNIQSGALPTNTLIFDSTVGPADINMLNGNPIISCPISLNDDLTINNNMASGLTLALNGVISGTNKSIVFNGGNVVGSGLISLNAANTYTGTTTILDRGQLFYGIDGAIPAASPVFMTGIAPMLSFNTIDMSIINAFDLTLDAGTVQQRDNRPIYLKSLSGAGSGNINIGVGSLSGNVLQITGNSNTTYGGSISAGGQNLLTNPNLGSRIYKSGSGILLFTGNNNSYLNSTFIGSGAIQIQQPISLGAIGATGSGVYIMSDPLGSGSLYIENNITMGNASSLKSFFINGDGFSSTGALRNLSGTNTIFGPLQVGWDETGIVGGEAKDATIQVDAGTLTWNGIIQGTKNLTKTNAGTLVFAGSTANTLSGTTIINGGTLQLNKTAGINALAANATINSGTLQLLAANQISDSSSITIGGGTFNLGGNSESIGQLVFNSGTLTQGGATLGLASASNALTMRDTTITGPINISNGGSVIFDASNNGTATISGSTLTLGSTDSLFDINNGTSATDMLISNTITSTGGGLSKSGLGTLEFAGNSANTYGGSTTISGGTLLLNKTAGINSIPGNVSINAGILQLAQSEQINDGSTMTLAGGTFNMAGLRETIGSLNFTSGTLTQGGATFAFSSSSVALTMRDTTISGPISINNGGQILFDAANNGTATIIGSTLSLGASSSEFNIQDGSAATDMLVSSIISSSGAGIVKTGLGTLEFAGNSSNTFTGTTEVSAGFLLLNKTGANAISGNVLINGGTVQFVQANQIVNSAVVDLNAGTFDIAGFGVTIDSLNFTGGTLTQGGAVLTLSNAITALTMRDTTINGPLSISNGGSVIFDATNNGTASLLGSTLSLGSTTTFDIAQGSSSTDMIITDVISGGGFGITKTGIGLLELAGSLANTYSGDTTVLAGTLLLNKTSGVNAIGGNAIINGGVLELGQSQEIPNAASVSLSGGTFNMAGFNETIDSLLFTSGTLTQSGGILTLANAVLPLTMRDTTISGPIVISNGGTVAFDATNNGTATLSGSTLSLGGATTFDIANGTAATDMLISDVISNGGSLTKIGLGQLELAGSTANTYSGNTTVSAGTLLLNKTSGINAIAGNAIVNGGTLQLAQSQQIADASTLTLSGGTFNMAGFNETISALTFTSGTLTQGGGILTLASAIAPLTMRDTTITGPIVISNGGTVAFDATNNGTATLSGSTLSLGAATTFDVANGTAATDMLISDVISNGGSLTKIGLGQLELAGATANTYSGNTTVSAGTLLLNKTSGINAIAGNAIVNGGTLQLAQSQQISYTSLVTLSGGTFNMAGFNETIGALTFTSGTLTQGGGILTLANATAPLTMRDTTITGPIVISNGGTIAFDATNNGTATLSGSTLSLNAATTFDIANGTAATDMLISDVISNGGSLTKIGLGQLELAGATANTYSGNTTVMAGTLLLNKTSGINAIAGNAIVSGGTLQLAQSQQIADTSTLTLSGGTFSMAGFNETIDAVLFTSGTLTQVGGVLTLSNSVAPLTMKDTTISGPIVISNGGTVAFDATNNGTATLSSSTLNLGATTNFDIANGTAATDMLISDAISGVGGLTKTGLGDLELTGSSANTYLGDTTISTGTLLLNKTSGVNAIGGNAIINGGVLELRQSQQISNTSLVTLSGGTFNMAGFNETIGSLTFTSGTLTQSEGVLTLSSAVTALTMRDTIISGPIAISNGGEVFFDATNNGTATILGNIDLSGTTPQFNISQGSSLIDMLISGNISNGGLTKIGNGLLLLSGINTYAGGTTISNGILQGSTVSLQGNILDNSELIFDQSFNGTYAGSLSGIGTLFKTGVGTVIFSGASTLDGLTTINEGSFFVNGTFGGLGNLIVDSGATLGGTGVISKNATISGKLAPGNSIGTIQFVGDVTLNSGSTLEIELNPTTSDLVDVIGSFTIEPGSTLAILPEAGEYEGLLSYLIVDTTGGVNGTFSTVTSSLPLFSTLVNYNPTNIILEGFFAEFSSLFPFGNVGAVAHCIDEADAPSGSDMSYVINQLRMIDSIELLEDALLQLQPSPFTSAAVAQENNILDVRDVIFNRLNDQHHSCFNLCDPRYQVWLSPFFGFSHQKDLFVSKALDNEPGFNALTPGLFVGIDRCVHHFYSGVGAGYSFTDLKWNHIRGSATMHSIYGALYGRLENVGSYIEASLMGGLSRFAFDRIINFPGVERTAFSEHNAAFGAIDSEAGLLFHFGRTRISPFLGLDFIYINENEFREHGADSLNLIVKEKNSSLLFSELGIDISHCLNMPRGTTPFLRISIIRESRFQGEREDAFLQGDCPLKVFGINPSRTLGAITAGVTSLLPFSDVMSCFYRGKFGNGFQDHAVNFEIRF